MSDWDRVAAALKPEAWLAQREQLMGKVVIVALAASQRRTPVKTGRLRRSETTRVTDRGLRGYLGTNVIYAPFVHARTPFFAQGIGDATPTIAGLLQATGDAFVGGVS